MIGGLSQSVLRTVLDSVPDSLRTLLQEYHAITEAYVKCPEVSSTTGT